ncbi:hypothetical protein D3Z60_22495 [Lachnospiraceae bacterium]|nr:hypothetical protein [Lachnospiraceae bacterium]
MDLNLESIQEALWDISEACCDVQYYVDCDDGSLLNALDGNEDDAYGGKSEETYKINKRSKRIMEDVSKHHNRSIITDIIRKYFVVI